MAARGVLARSHAFRVQSLIKTFGNLRVGATLKDDSGWYAIYTPPRILITFEYVHGLAPERYAYNADSVGKVERSGKVLLGDHAGFSDLFVPVGPKGNVEAVLISGPLGRRRPTAADLLERWRALTGREGHLSDPEFSHYVACVLETLTLDRELLHQYQSLLECYALLIAQRGDAEQLAHDALGLQQKLERARAAENAWDAAQSLVDEKFAGEWLSPHSHEGFSRLGVTGFPENVLVGLSIAGRGDAHPVDELLRRDAFQRACVELGRAKRTVCGKVGDHGVMFLVPRAKSPARLEATFRELADAVAVLGRRKFGLQLSFGTSALKSALELPARYEQALAAAERSLSKGLFLSHAEAAAPRRMSMIRERRRLLRLDSDESPTLLSTRFEQYLRAVADECGYRFETMSGHLLAGFDHAAEALLSSGALQEREHIDACAALDLATRNASTPGELLDAYRRAMENLVDLVRRPVLGARDRKLNRAMALIHSRFTGPLGIREAARSAGFAPGYFAQLFKQREKTTFDRYLKNLRVERAKHLLRSTELSAERVSKLSGFAYRTYFCRVFRQSVGVTPHAFRRATLTSIARGLRGKQVRHVKLKRQRQ
jgi:AraC-like DNA-binding protein